LQQATHKANAQQIKTMARLENGTRRKEGIAELRKVRKQHGGRRRAA
jgi:hypothetical protein